MQKEEEWMSMSDIARYFGVSRTNISKIVHKMNLETKDDIWDSRVVLVKLADVKNIFDSKYKRLQGHETQK